MSGPDSEAPKRRGMAQSKWKIQNEQGGQAPASRHRVAKLVSEKGSELSGQIGVYIIVDSREKMIKNREKKKSRASVIISEKRQREQAGNCDDLKGEEK